MLYVYMYQFDLWNIADTRRVYHLTKNPIKFCSKASRTVISRNFSMEIADYIWHELLGISVLFVRFCHLQFPITWNLILTALLLSTVSLGCIGFRKTLSVFHLLTYSTVFKGDPNRFCFANGQHPSWIGEMTVDTRQPSYCIILFLLPVGAKESYWLHKSFLRYGIMNSTWFPLQSL